jgi:hypothetical protein
MEDSQLNAVLLLINKYISAKLKVINKNQLLKGSFSDNSSAQYYC